MNTLRRCAFVPQAAFNRTAESERDALEARFTFNPRIALEALLGARLEN